MSPSLIQWNLWVGALEFSWNLYLHDLPKVLLLHQDFIAGYKS